MTKSKTILAVDDVPANTKLLKAKLSPQGYMIETANSGHELLEKISSSMPDLILLDVVMPGMDGYDACRRIRSDASIPYVPIIFITASQIRQKDVVYGLDIGGDDYIRKPFDTLELLSRVRAALRVKDLHDELAETKTELSRYVSLSTLRLVEKKVSEGIQTAGIKDVAVLFSDIRGFTDITENMEPLKVFEMLDFHLSTQMEIIEKHHGVIDKLNGDEIMAIFEGNEKTENALQCGIEIMTALSGVKSEHAGGRVAVGIGINEGPVYVGSLGSTKFKNFTVVGNTVNVAARLCGNAKKFQILFTEAMVNSIKGKGLNYSLVGDISMKGMGKPIRVFEAVR
jgi:adenylate cyclase